MSDAELAEEKRLAHEKSEKSVLESNSTDTSQSSSLVVVLAWTAVGIPLAWGTYKTIVTVGKFFN